MLPESVRVTPSLKVIVTSNSSFCVVDGTSVIETVGDFVSMATVSLFEMVLS